MSFYYLYDTHNYKVHFLIKKMVHFIKAPIGKRKPLQQHKKEKRKRIAPFGNEVQIERTCPSAMESYTIFYNSA